MSDFGIKFGSNINTNTDEQLKLTSKYSSLKIFKWGDASFTTNGSGVGSTSITHGLGYAPIEMVFRKVTAEWASQDSILPSTQYSNSFVPLGSLNRYAGGFENMDFKVYVDDDKLYISDDGLGNLQASTTYNFRYYILVDLSEEFSSQSNISLTGDRGFKFAKQGKNVLTSQEYDMAYSTKYKSLQYYENHVLEQTLTLPAMFASQYDNFVEAATYVDFNHNLTYPPLFLAFYGNSPTTLLTSVPFYQEDAIDNAKLSINCFCDASRVRVYFWRGSNYGPDTANWSEETINVKVVMFTEDLTGSESP